jgi:hypothetical protein
MTLQEILDSKRTEHGAFEIIEESGITKGVRIFRLVDVHNSLKARLHCDVESEPRILVEESFESDKLTRRTSQNITETFADGLLIARQVIDPDGGSTIERFHQGQRGAEDLPALTVFSAEGKAIVESWYEAVREGNIVHLGLRHRKPRRNAHGTFDYDPAHIERSFEADEQREYHFRANELTDPPGGRPAVVVRSVSNPQEEYSHLHFSSGRFGHPTLPAITGSRDGFSFAAHVQNGALVQPPSGSAITIAKENLRMTYDVNPNGSPQGRTVAIDLSSLPEIPEADKDRVVEYLKESLRSYLLNNKNTTNTNSSDESEADPGSWENFKSL